MLYFRFSIFIFCQNISEGYFWTMNTAMWHLLWKVIDSMPTKLSWLPDQNIFGKINSKLRNYWLWSILFTYDFLFLYRALLYGGMKESQLCEIELKDTPLTAFKHLLRYIYMGHMTLGNQKDELILEILGLAHK